MIGIPIFLIIAAIALLILHWDEVKAAMEKVWNFLSSVFGPSIQAFSDLFRGAFDAVVGAIKFFMDNALKILPLIFPPLLIIQHAPGLIMKAFDALVGFFKNLWNKIVQGFTGFVEAGKNLVIQFITGFVNAFKGFFGRVFDLGKQFVKAIMNGILNMLGPLGGLVRPVLESILGPLTGSPQLNPEIAARFHRVGADMSKAIGAGILDGAAGAERAIGSAVGDLTAATRNAPANGGSGGAGGTFVTIHFDRGSIVVTDAKDFADKVQDVLMTSLSRRGIRYGRRG